MRVAYRRRREGKTNYKKRLGMLKSGKLRLVVRMSSKNILAQVVQYEPNGDRILASANSKELEKLGWKFNRNNIPACYLVGLILGKKAKEKKLNDMIVDFGLKRSMSGGRLYSLLKGVKDHGVSFACGDVFPVEDRIKGKHMEAYAKMLKSSNNYQKQYSGYLKNNIDAEAIMKAFDEMKGKIKVT